MINKNIKELIIIATTLLLVINSYAWVDNYSPKIKRNSVILNKENLDAVSSWINWGEVSKYVSREVYSLDLNRDGKVDYIVNIGTTMNGLWAYYSNVIFILSSPLGYQINKTTCMGFDIKDIIKYKGENYYIMTAFSYWSNENGHNYWISCLYSFGKDGKIEEANGAIEEFLFVIQYTFKENHKVANNITKNEKIKIWENAKNQFIID